MRRILTALGALAVLMAAILVGILVSARLAPERFRAEIEAALAREVGPVSIGPVRPFFAWGFGIEVAELRLLDAGDGSALSAERVWFTLAPRSLLRGAPRPRRVDVRGLRLVALERSDGTWAPAALERARSASQSATADASPAASLRAIASKWPTVSIEDARLRAVRSDASTWSADLATLSFRHDPLGGAPTLRAAGRLDRPGAPDAGDAPSDLGTFELDASIDDPAPSGSLAVTNLALDAIPPALLAPLRAEGRVSGVASWGPAPGGGVLGLDLVGLGLRFARTRAAEEAGPAASFPSARLRAELQLDGAAVRARSFAWSSETVDLTGRFALERTGDGARRLDLDLRGGPVAVTAVRDLVRAATAPGSASRFDLDALAAGTIETFSVRAQALSLDGASASAEPASAATIAGWTRGLAIEASLAGVEIRPAQGESIRGLRGKLALEGEKLRIENAHAQLGDRRLPSLTLSLDGLGAALTALEHGSLPPVVPPLPGFGALDRWIDSLKRPGSPPRWRRIDVRADWIEHPVLLRPLDEVTATLAPANPGVHIRDAKGFWGGVPFRGSGSFHGGAESRIEVAVSLELPRRIGRRRSDAEAWGRARFHADLEKLGDFQAERLEGVAQGIGDRVVLRRGEARLRPRGDLVGSVDLDLSHGDAVPYRARIELAGGSLSDLMNDLKMDGGAARGTADIDAEIEGTIQAGRNVLADMNGPANLRLRDGEINKRMNVLFTLAQATETLNPFRSRETIPFERLDAPLRLEAGIARTEAFSLVGPALRMVGTGQVNLVEKPHQVEAVIGVFFFRSLDRVIGIFPILNRMLLGPDENLVSTYFAVSGPWADPRGSLIPTKSIAAGPASFVLEGLPAFVRGGLSTLERALTGGTTRAEPEVEPVAPPSPGGPS